MTSIMNIKFYGVRGSAPALRGNKIKIGGNTSCVLVEVNDTMLIFDAGTGIINLGEDYGHLDNMKGHIFFSHYHWDHIHGLPCYKPFYNKTNSFTLYGKTVDNESVETIIKGMMVPPYFPIALDDFGSQLNFYSVNPAEDIVINDITIHSIPIAHPGGCVGYSICYNNKKFCYMTDMDVTDNNEDMLVEFINKADLLVMDSYFTPEDYVKGLGHSNWKDVISIAKKSHVKQIGLYHHHLFKTDGQLLAIERKVKEEMKDAFLAREGMVIQLQ